MNSSTFEKLAEISKTMKPGEWVELGVVFYTELDHARLVRAVGSSCRVTQKGSKILVEKLT